MRAKSLALLTLIVTVALCGVLFANTVEFYDQVNYKGAFGSSNWMKGWTAMDSYGFLAADKEPTTEVTITDASLVGGEDYYWTADNIYVLDGLVYLEAGGVLNIEAGTIIKAKSESGENTSALVICNGAQIFAEGTASKPIIFTSINDDVSDPYDLDFNTRGEWGGLIIIGNATTNEGENFYIEGISEQSERTLVGGDDDDDNSGVLRYVSIRHGGTELAPGDEINGLTLGSVGRGTTIEYIEVFANKDDGFEWFGGTVNCSHLIAAYCGDDAFDHDQGLRTKMQFLFAIQDSASAGHLGEHDGGHKPEDGTPYAYPQVFNATLIGPGMESSQTDAAFNLRDNWGGAYKNSIIGDCAGIAMTVEDLEDETKQDSKNRLDAGEIVFQNNLWFDLAGGTTWAELSGSDAVAAMLGDAGNANELLNASPLTSISRLQDNGLDPRPAAGGVAYEDLAEIPNDGFFEQVNYKGAFGQTNWAKGWTALDEYGFFTEDKVPTTEVNVVDGDINAGDKVFWTADNIYVLDGLVYVESGAELNIEAGTVIKAKSESGENTSALVITNGAKIYAEGTGVNPIIFTSVNDDVTDPYDLDFNTRGEWGGLILIGNATTNEGENFYIEGISEQSERTLVGGDDDHDSSGLLRYISIRHGGTELAPGDEINGLTLGSVGDGTTIDHIEVFANKDDGYEWFGGTVSNSHLISAFCGDDAFDHDQGLRTKMQFLFAIQDSASAGHLGEHDGGHKPEDGTPFAFPEIYNATLIGPGMESSQTDAAFNLRDNWGGAYKNSIIGDCAGIAMTVEDLEDETKQDSKNRLDAGEIVFQNNLWFDFAGGNGWAELSGSDAVAAMLSDAANSNEFLASSPLTSISRMQDNGLDPRPEAGGVAYDGLAEIIETLIYESYQVARPVDYTLSQNYPNPFNPSTNIEYTVKQTANVNITVFNQLGQQVATLVNGVKTAGNYTITWDASYLTSGVYFYRMEAGSNVHVKKMILVK